MTENRKSSLSQSGWKRISIYGLVLGAGVVVVGFLLWFFMKGPPASPPSLTGGKAADIQVPHGETQDGETQAGKGLSVPPAATAKVTAESTPTLQDQLAQVLDGMREANQKKDLAQLLSHYSPNFPQLQQRVQHISKTWKIYDYSKMDFEIAEARILADKTAQARVTWNVEAKNINTLKNRNFLTIYLIRFANESGQWRIKSLQKVE
jgi:hypothetical protein